MSGCRLKRGAFLYDVISCMPSIGRRRVAPGLKSHEGARSLARGDRGLHPPSAVDRSNRDHAPFEAFEPEEGHLDVSVGNLCSLQGSPYGCQKSISVGSHDERFIANALIVLSAGWALRKASVAQELSSIGIAADERIRIQFLHEIGLPVGNLVIDEVQQPNRNPPNERMGRYRQSMLRLFHRMPRFPNPVCLPLQPLEHFDALL